MEQGFLAEFFGCAEHCRAFVVEWRERKQMPDLLRTYLEALERAEQQDFQEVPPPGSPPLRV